MPLRDHFRPALDKIASWEGFHGGWPMVIVQHLRRQLHLCREVRGTLSEMNLWLTNVAVTDNNCLNFPWFNPPSGPERELVNDIHLRNAVKMRSRKAKGAQS
jgi:hypothetical protein